MSAIYYHMPQVQGYMEILDVEYCDLMSYTTKVHPPRRQARPASRVLI